MDRVPHASMPAADVLIHVDRLQVHYGSRCALRDVSFSVHAGEVVGLLGPNGAGKTTTLSVLATLIRPSAGNVTIGGHSATTEATLVRRSLGVVPQSLALYPTFTAQENALLFAQLSALRGQAARTAAQAALQLVGLEERACDLVATFSGGMQRRLNLACGILHAPRVLLLDEPTAGVDPQSRERIIEAVRAQAQRGAAVLYSTHYLEEAERVCDRVVLIDEGQLITEGTPEQLIQKSGGPLRLDIVTRRDLPEAWCVDLPGVSPMPNGAFRSTRGVALQVALLDLRSAALVLDRAERAGGGVIEFHIHQPGLQEVFMALTGRALRD